MCGFAGALNTGSNLLDGDVAKFAAQVSHRGPDSCNVVVFDERFAKTESGNSAVFFNRLAILDLDPRSDQPFSDEQHVLLFNGEIYNYAELKQRLHSQGVSFKTTSDTEVLFYALKLWGTEALAKLNGMFAFCWIDKTNRRFLIARDRLGIKPLFYSCKTDGFYFASELDSICSFLGQTQLNQVAIDMYMWMQFVPTPHTIYKDVFKLPPGHYIEGSLDHQMDPTPITFWDAYAPVNLNLNSKSSLEDVLKNSLARQLHSDVPLGLFLSSGVDSSLLAAMVNKHFAKEQQFNFFTVGFSELTASDESYDAERFIKGFKNPNLKSETIVIDPELIGDHLDKLYSFYDEPFGDPASLLNWLISKKAREHVTVAISGDGADELFWGYDRYRRWAAFKQRNAVSTLKLGLKLAGTIAPGSRTRDNFKWAGESDPVKLHYNLFLPSGVRFKVRDHIATKDMWALENIAAVADRADLPAILDIKTYLADAMLYKVDRSSMASSLEVRVPYLDNEVLDFALQMPLTDKSTIEYPHKAPLKKLLKQLAPHYQLQTVKKGFSFPLQQWMQTKWKDRLADTITPNNLASVGLDARYFDVYRTFASTGKYFTDVWFMYNLLLWKENKASRR